MSQNNDDRYNDNTCVVCFKNVEIFSIGDCDHPVCYECSTRMRVLCRQNECPICRHDMQKVIFTKSIQPFKELDRQMGLKHSVDRKFKIVFESQDIQNAYNTLLAHVCSKCSGRHAFQTFIHLRDHMRKEHELFYCDLCVANLKILTHERRCYTRKELATHRRQGDTDNRSHRGHPLCEFCNERYMDNDELFRHLRRDHLFCHFCDADGLHQYYDSYDFLRNHFREQHYLCEEGDCYNEKFTSAFRTEIDLKAHRASVHGRQMTKAAVKQARTLELEFTLKPRPRQTGRSSRYHQNVEEEEGAVGGTQLDYRPSQQSKSVAAFSKINTDSNDEFPSLGGSSATTAQHGLHFTKPRRAGGGGGSLRGLSVNDSDFPALGPDSPQSPTSSTSVSLRVNSVSAADRTKGAGAKPANLSIHVNHRPGASVTATVSKNVRDPFPALQQNYSSLSHKPLPPKLSQPQWGDNKTLQSSKSKPVQPPAKPAQRKPRQLYDDLDFPMENAFPALSGNLPSHIANLASTQWSSGREQESKFTINRNKPSQSPPPKLPQPKTFHIEDDFPSLNSRFDASCSFTSEPKVVKSKSPESKIKKESSISISMGNDWSKSVKNTASTDNMSSDSDIGSKKSNKKKKNKSKTKKDSDQVKTENINNNNEGGKKNKQKDLPKSKAKQIKVESQAATTQPSKNISAQTNMPQDTLERKRSELKIESVNGQSTPENSIDLNDFPSLSNSRLPPGFTNSAKEKTPAPPGFELPSTAPPPGFHSITLNSVARQSSNGLTFTSSSGQNYPIPSGESGRVFSYVAPPNVKQRNTALVTHVTDTLGSQSALDQFMVKSAEFRQGALPAAAYYAHCQESMGSGFTTIFPELLVLLPDIEKQQELWRVAGSERKWRLDVCAACGQVVASTDFKHHLATHSLENHFPVLANGLSSSQSNAWTTK